VASIIKVLNYLNRSERKMIVVEDGELKIV